MTKRSDGSGSGPGKNRCIIHIGMHKTASTSIQRSLEGFSDRHFFYAKLVGGANQSLAMYSMFAAAPERHHIHRTAGRDQGAVAKFVEQVRHDLERSIQAARGRTLIVSGEDISSLTEADLFKLRDYFDARFDDVQVVGYVRPPAGFLTSSFQQRVKSGTLNALDMPRLYRSYRASFGKFDNVFGAERVHLWKFDPSAFPDNNAVIDFCRRLGIALGEGKTIRLNESLSAPAVAALFTYNKFGKMAGRSLIRDARGRAILALLSGPKFRLSPDTTGPFLKQKHADIAWMEQRLGESLHENVKEHQATDIRDEADLLRPNPEIVDRLKTALGRRAPAGVEGRTPREVAELLDALWNQSEDRPTRWWRFPLASLRRLKNALTQTSRTAKSVNVVDAMTAADPRLLRGIAPDTANIVVAKAFGIISRSINDTDNGDVAYSRFGRFQITRRAGAARTRVQYRPENEKQPKRAP